MLLQKKSMLFRVITQPFKSDKGLSYGCKTPVFLFFINIHRLFKAVFALRNSISS